MFIPFLQFLHRYTILQTISRHSEHLVRIFYYSLEHFCYCCWCCCCFHCNFEKKNIEHIQYQLFCTFSNIARAHLSQHKKKKNRPNRRANDWRINELLKILINTSAEEHKCLIVRMKNALLYCVYASAFQMSRFSMIYYYLSGPVFR